MGVLSLHHFIRIGSWGGHYDGVGDEGQVGKDKANKM